MSDNPQANDGQPQQINLQQIAQQFMSGLQRHFDMLAFNMAARDGVLESAYLERVNAPKIMPAAPHHQNFEQMQAYAKDLLLRQVVGDCVNLAVNAMNNAHFFLVLVKATKANPDVSPEAQKVSQATQKMFLSAPLDEKFNKLEQDYGIMCELEDTVISLGHVMQVLVQQGGMVKEAQLDGSDELLIELKAIKILSRASNAEKTQAKLVDQRKVFRDGDLVEFSDTELQLILVTIASFADSLFKSVAHYAQTFKDTGAGEG